MALKYNIIKSKKQFREYTNILEDILFSGSKNRDVKDEIALLTLLVEKWEAENCIFKEVDPIRLLRSFMNDHKMGVKDLVGLLGINKNYVTDILNYKRGLPKEVICKLADHFKVSTDAFNRPYKIIVPLNSHLRYASVMNTKKELAIA